MTAGISQEYLQLDLLLLTGFMRLVLTRVRTLTTTSITIRWSHPPTKIVRIASKFALVQLIKTEKLYVNLVVYDLIERNSKVEEIPRVLLQLKALTWLKAL